MNYYVNELARWDMLGLKVNKICLYFPLSVLPLRNLKR
jgi:hypothetical protein